MGTTQEYHGYYLAFPDTKTTQKYHGTTSISRYKNYYRGCLEKIPLEATSKGSKERPIYYLIPNYLFLYYLTQ